MTFFRPEAKAVLWRWREVLVAAGLILVGVWWIAGPGRLLVLPGGALVIGGAALGVVGLRRLRFRAAGDGQGAVQVDEGQVAYFGPLSGGVIALSALERLSLDHSVHPAHWQLEAQGQAPLYIPVNAAGSDALFDAFSTLPGLRIQRMLSELGGQRDHAVVIWERKPLRPAHALLH